MLNNSMLTVHLGLVCETDIFRLLQNQESLVTLSPMSKRFILI